MSYRSIKVGERIIFIPDDILKERLQRLNTMLALFITKSPISTFGKSNGLKNLLWRHKRDRFFIIVDFEHAFHQVTRQMIAHVFWHALAEQFDDCFVSLGGQYVIPTGFPTSSYFFEILMSKKIDQALLVWLAKVEGHATRHGDNILLTWPKDVPTALADLLKIFKGFQVRFTPKQPRKWKPNIPIRFCGYLLPIKESPRFSRKRRRNVVAGIV